MYSAMKTAWQGTVRHGVADWAWRTESVRLPPRTEASFAADASRRVLDDPRQASTRRANAAFQLAWLRRSERSIELSCLDLGKALVLHLPGEPFVEYQLRAQALRKDAMVCVAGYGDGGPGYLPTAAAYLEGGYEPTVALAAPQSETLLTGAIAKLLRP
jgi:hypothetical protein